jgi:hypothetical protein
MGRLVAQNVTCQQWLDFLQSMQADLAAAFII